MPSRKDIIAGVKDFTPVVFDIAASQAKSIGNAVMPEIMAQGSELLSGAQGLRRMLSSFRQSRAAVNDANRSNKASYDVLRQAQQDVLRGEYAFNNISQDSSDLMDAFEPDTDEEGVVKDATNAQLGKAIMASSAQSVQSSKEAATMLSKTFIKASQAQSLQLTNMTMMNIQNMNAQFNIIGKKIDKTNALLGAMLRYQNENVTQMHNVQMQYMEASMEAFNQIAKGTSLFRSQRSSDQYSNLFGDGILNLGEYGKIVSKNIEKTPLAFLKEVPGILSSGGSKTQMGMGLGSLVLGAIMSNITGGGRGRSVSSKFGMGNMSSNLTEYIGSMLERVGDQGRDFTDLSTKGSLKRMLGQIFGIKRTDPNKGPKLKDYYKEEMGWNGVAQKALVDVIPQHLGRIENQLVAMNKAFGTEADREDERVFDYRSGKFQTRGQVRKDYSRRINAVTQKNFMESQHYMDMILDAVPDPNDSSKQLLSPDKQNELKLQINGAAQDILSGRLTTDEGNRKIALLGKKYGLSTNIIRNIQRRMSEATRQTRRDYQAMNDAISTGDGAAFDVASILYNEKGKDLGKRFEHQKMYGKTNLGDRSYSDLIANPELRQFLNPELIRYYLDRLSMQGGYGFDFAHVCSKLSRDPNKELLRYQRLLEQFVVGSDRIEPDDVLSALMKQFKEDYSKLGKRAEKIIDKGMNNKTIGGLLRNFNVDSFKPYSGADTILYGGDEEERYTRKGEKRHRFTDAAEKMVNRLAYGKIGAQGLYKDDLDPRTIERELAQLSKHDMLRHPNRAVSDSITNLRNPLGSSGGSMIDIGKTQLKETMEIKNILQHNDGPHSWDTFDDEAFEQRSETNVLLSDIKDAIYSLNPNAKQTSTGGVILTPAYNNFAIYNQYKRNKKGGAPAAASSRQTTERANDALGALDQREAQGLNQSGDSNRGMFVNKMLSNNPLGDLSAVQKEIEDESSDSILSGGYDSLMNASQDDLRNEIDDISKDALKVFTPNDKKLTGASKFFYTITKSVSGAFRGMASVLGGLFGKEGFFGKFKETEFYKFMFDPDNPKAVFGGVTRGLKSLGSRIKYEITGEGYTDKYNEKTYGDKTPMYDQMYEGFMSKAFGEDYENTSAYQVLQLFDRNRSKKRDKRMMGKYGINEIGDEDYDKLSEDETAYIDKMKEAISGDGFEFKGLGNDGKFYGKNKYGMWKSFEEKFVSVSGEIFDNLEEAGEDAVTRIFGEEKNNDELNKAFSDIVEFAKKAAPKAAIGGLGGAVLGGLAGGKLGLLGLLGGGGVLVTTGMAVGILSQSEKFKDFMFGTMDENNERTGGVITKSMQDSLKANLPRILKGGAAGAAGALLLGGVSGMFGGGAIGSGLGFMFGTLLPGGILGGAIVGITASLLLKNTEFSKFLFGEKDEEGNYKSGIGKYLDKLKEKLPGGVKGAAAIMAGTTLTGLLPLSIPLAVGSLALGIAGQTERVKSFLFGEQDEETGKRKGGLIGRLTDTLKARMLEPIKDTFKLQAAKTDEWFKKNIIVPISDIKDSLNSTIAGPWADFLTRMGNVFGKIAGGMARGFTNFLTHPIRSIATGLVKMAMGSVRLGMKGALAIPSAIVKRIARRTTKGRTRELAEKKYNKAAKEKARELAERDGLGYFGYRHNYKILKKNRDDDVERSAYESAARDMRKEAHKKVGSAIGGAYGRRKLAKTGNINFTPEEIKKWGRIIERSGIDISSWGDFNNLTDAENRAAISQQIWNFSQNYGDEWEADEENRSKITNNFTDFGITAARQRVRSAEAQKKFGKFASGTSKQLVRLNDNEKYETSEIATFLNRAKKDKNAWSDMLGDEFLRKEDEWGKEGTDRYNKRINEAIFKLFGAKVGKNGKIDFSNEEDVGEMSKRISDFMYNRGQWERDILGSSDEEIKEDKLLTAADNTIETASNIASAIDKTTGAFKVIEYKPEADGLSAEDIEKIEIEKQKRSPLFGVVSSILEKMGIIEKKEIDSGNTSEAITKNPMFNMANNVVGGNFLPKADNVSSDNIPELDYTGRALTPAEEFQATLGPINRDLNGSSADDYKKDMLRLEETLRHERDAEDEYNANRKGLRKLFTRKKTHVAEEYENSRFMFDEFTNPMANNSMFDTANNLVGGTLLKDDVTGDGTKEEGTADELDLENQKRQLETQEETADILAVSVDEEAEPSTKRGKRLVKSKRKQKLADKKARGMEKVKQGLGIGTDMFGPFSGIFDDGIAKGVLKMPGAALKTAGNVVKGVVSAPFKIASGLGDIVGGVLGGLPGPLGWLGKLAGVAIKFALPVMLGVGAAKTIAGSDVFQSLWGKVAPFYETTLKPIFGNALFGEGGSFLKPTGGLVGWLGKALFGEGGSFLKPNGGVVGFLGQSLATGWDWMKNTAWPGIKSFLLDKALPWLADALPAAIKATLSALWKNGEMRILMLAMAGLGISKAVTTAATIGKAVKGAVTAVTGVFGAGGGAATAGAATSAIGSTLVSAAAAIAPVAIPALLIGGSIALANYVEKKRNEKVRDDMSKSVEAARKYAPNWEGMTHSEQQQYVIQNSETYRAARQKRDERINEEMLSFHSYAGMNYLLEKGIITSQEYTDYMNNFSSNLMAGWFGTIHYDELLAYKDNGILSESDFNKYVEENGGKEDLSTYTPYADAEGTGRSWTLAWSMTGDPATDITFDREGNVVGRYRDDANAELYRAKSDSYAFFIDKVATAFKDANLNNSDRIPDLEDMRSADTMRMFLYQYLKNKYDVDSEEMNDGPTSDYLAAQIAQKIVDVEVDKKNKNYVTWSRMSQAFADDPATQKIEDRPYTTYDKFGPFRGPTQNQRAPYSQSDNAWAKVITGIDSNGTRYTMEDSGCGPTALAEIATRVHNKVVTPDEVMNYAKKGNFLTDGAAKEELFSTGARGLGLIVDDVTRNGLKSALKRNKQVIVVGNNVNNEIGNPFTSAGHAIVLEDISGNGVVTYVDPTDGQRKTTTLRILQDNMSKAWAYTKQGETFSLRNIVKKKGYARGILANTYQSDGGGTPSTVYTAPMSGSDMANAYALSQTQPAAGGSSFDKRMAHFGALTRWMETSSTAGKYDTAGRPNPSGAPSEYAFGAYQLTHDNSGNKGDINFINWMKNQTQYAGIAQALSNTNGSPLSGEALVEPWKKAYNTYGNLFAGAQDAYAKKVYWDDMFGDLGKSIIENAKKDPTWMEVAEVLFWQGINIGGLQDSLITSTVDTAATGRQVGFLDKIPYGGAYDVTNPSAILANMLPMMHSDNLELKANNRHPPRRNSKDQVKTDNKWAGYISGKPTTTRVPIIAKFFGIEPLASLYSGSVPSYEDVTQTERTFDPAYASGSGGLGASPSGNSTNVVGLLSEYLLNSEYGDFFKLFFGGSGGGGASSGFGIDGLLSGTMREKVVQAAISQMNYRERDHATIKFNGAPKGAWCAGFVSWCLDQAGVPRDVAERSNSSTTQLNWYKARNRIISSTDTPQPGDIAFMNKHGPKGADWKTTAYHIGIVEKHEGGYLYTIEGNTSADGSSYSDSGGVVNRKKRIHTLGQQNSYVNFIARPDYPDGGTASTSGSLFKNFFNSGTNIVDVINNSPAASASMVEDARNAGYNIPDGTTYHENYKNLGEANQALYNNLLELGYKTGESLAVAKYGTGASTIYQVSVKENDGLWYQVDMDDRVAIMAALSKKVIDLDKQPNNVTSVLVPNSRAEEIAATSGVPIGGPKIPITRLNTRTGGPRVRPTNLKQNLLVRGISPISSKKQATNIKPISLNNPTYTNLLSRIGGPMTVVPTSETLTSGNDRTKVVDIAKTQIGYLEKASNKELKHFTTNAGSGNYNKYAMELNENGMDPIYHPDHWCAYFVSWCLMKANIPTYVAPRGASCTENHLKWYKKNNRILTDNDIPRGGDIIFFNSKDSVGSTDYWDKARHIGIVEKHYNGYVYTIEGNTSASEGVESNGDGVYNKKYAYEVGGNRKDDTIYHSINYIVRPLYPNSSKKDTAQYYVGGPVIEDFFNKTLGPTTQQFGTNGTRGHGGYDFYANNGQNIYSPVSGVVTDLKMGKNLPGYGNYMEVKDQSGVYHGFAHISRTDLKPGDVIDMGAPLAKAGSVGARGAHLHYETANVPMSEHGGTTLANESQGGLFDPQAQIRRTGGPDLNIQKTVAKDNEELRNIYKRMAEDKSEAYLSEIAATLNSFVKMYAGGQGNNSLGVTNIKGGPTYNVGDGNAGPDPSTEKLRSLHSMIASGR